MLFITCALDISEELKAHFRKEIKEKTGEDCVFMPDFFSDVRSIPVKKEQPLWRRLFRSTRA